MAKKYLDDSGLLYFWGKLKNAFAPSSHTHTQSEITDLDVSDEVFIATYNSTTYADVLAAYNAGQAVFCKYGDYFVPLSQYYNSREFYFYYFRNGSAGRYTLTTSGWSYGTLSFVSTSRKVNGKALSSDVTLSASDVGAQEELVSGTNIKTINNTSLLGSGNIDISGGGGGGGVTDVEVDGTSVVSGGVAQIDLTGKQNTLVSGSNIKTVNSQSLLGSGDVSISVPSKTSDLTNDSGFISEDSSGNVSIAGSMTVEGHLSAIGYRPSQASGSKSVSSGTTWARQSVTLQVDPGVWIVTAYANCPGGTSGDRGLGITYGTSTGNMVQSRQTQRANAGGSVASMMTTMVIGENSSSRTYDIEYFQNSGSAKTVEFRLNAVRIA